MKPTDLPRSLGEAPTGGRVPSPRDLTSGQSLGKWRYQLHRAANGRMVTAAAREAEINQAHSGLPRNDKDNNGQRQR